MAFTYRNPIEQTINSLPSKYSDQILSKTADKIIERVDDLNSLFSFSMKKETEALLVGAGIELAPLGFQVHSHPACKTIENHIVYRVLVDCIKKIPSIALVSMRDEKAKRLIKRRNFSKYGEIQSLPAFNACIDWKDRYRYQNPSEEPFCHEATLLNYRRECLNNGWFPKTIFLHDELHFWEPEDICRLFSIVPETGSVLATVVCPIELLTGDAHSRNPRIYNFEVDGEHFHFFPDGVASEGYRQKISSTTWPLKYCTIKSGDVILKVSVIYSLYAHHLVSIERGCIPQNVIFLSKPDCLIKKELEIISSRLSDSTIERSTMLSILLYLSCLKNPNKESALAKLRQLEKRDLFPDEAFLVSSLSSAFMKYGLNKELDDSIFSKLLDKTISCLPSFVGALLSKERVWQSAFREFAKEIAVKHIMFRRGTYLTDEYTGVYIKNIRSNDRTPSLYSFKISKMDGSILSVLGDVLNDGNQVLLPKDTKEKVNFDVIRKKEVQTTIIISPTPLFLTLKPHSDETFPNSTETFSRSGLVIEDFMDPNVIETEPETVRTRKNACVIKAIAEFLKRDPDELLNTLLDSDLSENLMDLLLDDKALPLEVFTEIGIVLNIHIITSHNGIIRRFNISGEDVAGIVLKDGHATAMDQKDFALNFKAEILRASRGVMRLEERIKCPNEATIKINLSRAKKLVDSFIRGSTGILRSVSDQGCDYLVKIGKVIDELINSKKELSCSVGISTGAPGSGKSQTIKRALNGDHGLVSMVVSPRRALAEEWSASLKGTIHKVYTFEAALTKTPRNVKRVILDEASLYPPGYFDLISIISLIKTSVKGTFSLDNPKGVAGSLKEENFNKMQFIMIGDPLQTFYYSELDSILLERKHDFTIAMENIKGPLNYLWYSHRLPSGFNSVIDIPCLGKNKFQDIRFFADTSAIRTNDYDALLVASHEDKKNQNLSLMPMTFGESQGITFDKKVLILLSDDVLRVSPNALMVAISRSRVGFDFVITGNKTLIEFKKLSEKRLLGYILGKRQIPKERLKDSIPVKEVNFIEAFGNLEDKASNDLFILPEVQPNFQMADEPEIEKIEILPTWFKCHIPQIKVNPLLGEIFEKMEAKEKREFWHTNLGCSEQFPDTDKGLVSSVMGTGFRFSAVFPRHSGDDSVTFWEGVRKRLHFSNPRVERGKLEENRELGSRLCDIFLKHLPERFEVIGEDIEMGLNSFNEKRAQKPESMWINHMERSDIDWPLNHVFLFMKSQLCTKEEKMFTDAKAGQTLACFQHTVLFRMGPMLRAIERAFLRSVGESYYIHSGKNFMALNEFVLHNSHLIQGKSIESDYEAFDGSQDTLILAFESALLKRMGVSRAFIDDYESLKLNLGCKLGSMAVMRFTGEFCTFLFNTFANMLFTFLKYDVKSCRDRILFAGDDMCSLGYLRRNSSENGKYLNSFTLKAKEQVKGVPMFCGWFLSCDGILKSPRLLWARICAMKEKGNIKLCMDNYFLEAVFAYNLGERLYLILSDEELDYHYAVTRFFIESRHMLVGDARKAAFGCLENFGSECPSSKLTTSSYVQKKLNLKLKPLKAPMCTATLVSSSRVSSTVSGDLSQTSKLWTLSRMGLLFQIFSFLTKMNWSTSPGKLENITTCTSELSLSPSHHSSPTLKRRVVLLYYMMVLLLTREMGTSRVTTSTLETDHHTLFCVLDTAYLALIHIYATVLGCLLKCLESSTWPIGRFSPLILELCIGWLILPASLKIHQAGLVGHSRQFRGLNYLTSAQRPRRFFKGFQDHSKLKCSTRGIFSKIEVSLCQRNFLGHESTELTGHLPQNQNSLSLMGSYLGQLLCILKINIMTTVEAVIRLTIRAAVSEWLWSTKLDPQKIFWPDLAQNTERTPAQRKMKKEFISAYLRVLFGNIAVLGSSTKTQWPNVEIQVPPVIFNKDGLNHTLNTTINLAMVINGIEELRSIHEDANFRNATFRQICECYAKEAMHFLKANFNNGVATNIYKKWPKALDAAPWVAFDFCAGLDYFRLAPDEKKVIDRLTKRLFRTEGQKAVYEAGAETNVDIEG